MSATLQQIYALNPTTVIGDNDLFYLVQSPYTPGTDAGIKGSDLKTALGRGTVTSISAGTGITLTPNPITTTGTIALTVPVAVINGGTGLTSTTINQVLFSSANNVIAGISAVNNAVMVSSAGGVPSFSTTLPSGLTIPGFANAPTNTNITSMTGLTGKIEAPTAIADTSGNNNLAFTYSPSSVNYITSVNSATALPVKLVATGTDASIVFGIGAKNSYVQVYDASNTVGGKIRFIAADQVHYTGLGVATGQLTSIDFVLPGADGSNGSLLKTDGAGNWSFTTSTYPSTNALGDIIYGSATNVFSTLTGNITTTKQYLSQTGTGAVSAAPSWSTISGSDITGAALTKTDDTNVTLTLGGTPATALLRAASLTLGWTGQLGLTRGGTNASLVASNGGIVWSNASQFQILSGTATANQVLLSGSSATPAWSTATYPATTTINQILYSSAANTIGGISTANSAMLITSSTGVPSFTASMTNGQVVIGSTGASPVPGTIGSGTGITVTNGAGTISIATSGADHWVDETGSSVTMAVNTGYTSDDGAALVTFTLPTTSAIGDWVEINGKGSGLWKIAQASGQQINVGTLSSTLGATGSVASVNQFDCVKLRCITANTIWNVVYQQSSGLTVV